MNQCDLSAAPRPDQAMIVRQPIFGRDKDIWGYELLSSSGPVAYSGEDGASLTDFVGIFQEYCSKLTGKPLFKGKRLFLNIPEGVDLKSDTLPEGWKQCVFGICRGAADVPACQGFAESVRTSGGCVALDGNVEPESASALLGTSDIIKVSMAGKTPPEFIDLRRKYKDFEGKLLVTDVNSWETFEGTRALGFSYFQGPFFAIPQVKDDSEFPASSVAKLQLLQKLGNPDCEMDELASVIASDISLSYRILKYINSAFFGLRSKIKSIQQAVSLLGLDEVRHWSTVVVMSDLDPAPRGEELSYMALQRGRFLSELTESFENFQHSPNTMFMLGLFSKLDALLSYPMKKALEDIPLDDAIKDGLCGTLNEFRAWLLLLDAVETGNWDVANRVLGKYGACLNSASIQYMKASSWAADHLPQMKG